MKQKEVIQRLEIARTSVGIYQSNLEVLEADIRKLVDKCDHTDGEGNSMLELNDVYDTCKICGKVV